jgi:hypothetical protein
MLFEALVLTLVQHMPFAAVRARLAKAGIG